MPSYQNKALVLLVSLIALNSSGESSQAKSRNGSQQIQFAGLEVYKDEYGIHSNTNTVLSSRGRLTVEGKADHVYSTSVGVYSMRKFAGGIVSVNISFPSFAEDSKKYEWGTNVDRLEVFVDFNSGDEKIFRFHNLGDGSARVIMEYPSVAMASFDQFVFLGDNLNIARNELGEPSHRSAAKPLSASSTWVYGSKFTEEAYRVVQVPGLVHQFHSAIQVISFMDQHFRTGHEMDLKEISKIANDPTILQKIDSLARWAVGFDMIHSPVNTAAKQIDLELVKKSTVHDTCCER